MADAVSTADLEHLWDPAAQPMFTVKPPDWIATYLPRYCQSAADRTDSDCRGLALMVRELQRDAFWQQLFPDWEKCCQALFKRPAEWVEQVVEGVRVLHSQGHQGEVSEHQALVASKRAEKTAQHASKLYGKFAEPGNPHFNLDIVKVTSQGEGGNSAGYLAARLKKAGRDDLLQQIGPDKPYRSVRAAAIEAGIIKPVPTIRLVADLNVVAAKLCQHLTPEQRHTLAEALLQ